jgi:hypothetical protein
MAATLILRAFAARARRGVLDRVDLARDIAGEYGKHGD